MLKHKVCINLSRKNDTTIPILRSGQRTLRSRILDFLLGREVGVFVISPGRSVELVEIRELPTGGEVNG